MFILQGRFSKTTVTFYAWFDFRTLLKTTFPHSSPLERPLSLSSLQLSNFHFREIRAFSAIISLRIAPRRRCTEKGLYLTF